MNTRMNARTQTSVVGYVGTTLSFMNKREAWEAAQALATKTLDEMDSYLQTLAADIQDELHPLVMVLRDPLQLKVDEDTCCAEDIRSFILELIPAMAQNLIDHQPIHEEKDVATISAEIQAEQTRLRTSSITGNDRSNNVDHVSDNEITLENIAWFQTAAGQAYLSNLQAESSNTSEEEHSSEENGEMLIGVLLTSIRYANDRLAPSQTTTIAATNAVNRSPLAISQAYSTYMTIQRETGNETLAFASAFFAGVSLFSLHLQSSSSLWQRPRNDEDRQTDDHSSTPSFSRRHSLDEVD